MTVNPVWQQAYIAIWQQAYIAIWQQAYCNACISKLNLCINKLNYNFLKFVRKMIEHFGG